MSRVRGATTTVVAAPPAYGTASTWKTPGVPVIASSTGDSLWSASATSPLTACEGGSKSASASSALGGPAALQLISSTGKPVPTRSDRTKCRSRSPSLSGAGASRSVSPKRSSASRTLASGVPSAATSRSASAIRPRTPACHVRLVAPSAATAPDVSTSARWRRESASEASTRIQIAAYHPGHRPLGSSARGPTTAAIAANAGATTGGSPRVRPSTSTLAALMATSSEAAARKSATSQPSQSSALTPPGGVDTPLPSERRRNGPLATTATMTTAAIQRGAARTRVRRMSSSPRSTSPLAMASAPTLAVYARPTSAK